MSSVHLSLALVPRPLSARVNSDLKSFIAIPRWPYAGFPRCQDAVRIKRVLDGLIQFSNSVIVPVVCTGDLVHIRYTPNGLF